MRAFRAPRSLKDPVNIVCSCFKKTSQPQIWLNQCECVKFVRTTPPRIRVAARAISSNRTFCLDMPTKIRNCARRQRHCQTDTLVTSLDFYEYVSRSRRRDQSCAVHNRNSTQDSSSSATSTASSCKEGPSMIHRLWWPGEIDRCTSALRLLMRTTYGSQEASGIYAPIQEIYLQIYLHGSTLRLPHDTETGSPT